MRAALALFTLFSSAVFALDTSKLKPAGYVNDFAHALDGASAQRLEAYCANLERVTGAQMAIVLVDSLEDEPVEDVANRLFREWGIGKKGKDEGILVLLAVRDRKNRIEVGYGLEPIVPDGFAGGVLRGIRPILRQGDYAGALFAAAQQLGSRIAQAQGVDLGEAREPVRGGRVRPEGTGIPWPLLIVGFFVLMWILGRFSGGGRGGGGFTGFLAGMILGNMMGRGRSGWGGGGFGGYGSGGGGGGFGGFGGGDSGGGGASSNW